MSKLTSSVLSSCLFASVVVVAACSTERAEDSAERFNADPSGAVDASAAAAAVVASLTTSDGATIRFIDESGPGEAPNIGVEISSSTVTPSTDALLAQQPTALELHLALAPGKAAPAQLVADHATASGATPRHLAVASLDGETLEPYNCGSVATWQGDFTTWAPVLAGTYIMPNESGTTSGYVGYAPKFYFDVCRPSSSGSGAGSHLTQVQRRSNSGAAWSVINGLTNVLSGANLRWRYYHSSFTCSSFQYRLYVDGFSTYTYHRAARWASEWSCSIEN